MTLAKAVIYVEWDSSSDPEALEIQYNPTEYTLDKSAQVAEVQIPGLDAPLQQFVRGQSEKLSLDLFFDTTQYGMGGGATSVTTETDKIYQLIKIIPNRHAPPILTFVWSSRFPGNSIGNDRGSEASASERTAPGATASPARSAAPPGGAGPAVSGASSRSQSQRRNGFCCVMESIKQRFTLFSSEGIPLRATLTVSLRSYQPLSDQLRRLHRSSPDRTHAHVTDATDSLARIANRYYDTPGSWRAIADHNGIEDPRRLAVGRFLEVPRLERS